jgi:hypothetical protein
MTVLLALLLAVAAPAAPAISVEEGGGGYTVAARFTVAEPDDVVREVLTDYANIPRFMPDVKASEVVAREAGHVRVQQEAVSKYLFFSKRVHLVLDVEEGAEVIRFRNRCPQSFTHYEGAWTIRRQGAYTEVHYELRAQPAFTVPGFVLRRLLNRDAGVMIERLRAEIAARALR